MSIFSRAFNSLTNVLSSGVRMSASPRLLGRYSGGAGAGQEIQLGAGFSFAGDTLNYTAGGATTDGLTTSDGTAAAVAGKLGEYLENGPAVFAAMTSPNSQSIASISLTPGDWDVSAGLMFRLTSATASSLQSAVHTSATIPFTPGFPLNNNLLAAGGSGIFSVTHHTRQVRVTTTTTIYLVVAGTFTGTIEAAGQITARRVR